MKITDILSASSALRETRSIDKPGLLQSMSERAAAALHLEAGIVREAIFRREDLGSTGVGGGVAVPHARLGGIDRPFGMLVVLKRPIEFEAVDGKPVDIVFLLLLPLGADGDALNALACAARALRNPGTVDQLRHAADAEALYAALSAANTA